MVIVVISKVNNSMHSHKEKRVLYTSAETLRTAANINKWHNWFLVLAVCKPTYRHLLYWTVYIRMCAWAQADQQGRMLGGATVPGHCTKQLCLV